MMILVAGPYRSGTGDDPVLIAENNRAMTEAALQLFRRGHLAVTGEMVAIAREHGVPVLFDVAEVPAV